MEASAAAASEAVEAERFRTCSRLSGVNRRSPESLNGVVENSKEIAS